jgi:histidinol-phosphatase (PHP family)
VVPEGNYAEVMRGFRERHAFDYIVGSVHHVTGYIIDYIPEIYAKALEACGGPEPLAVRYWGDLARMVETLRHEVIGHIDLYRKQFPDDAAASTLAIQRAAGEALEIIREQQCIIDVNTGGLRKGFGHPYPVPWIIEAARDMGIPMCFGDDSHNVSQVGYGLDEARDYLLSLGVAEIETLEPGVAGLNRRRIPLG